MPQDRDSETCWAEVDLDALRSNFRLAKSLLPPDVPILPVVKADAYGHGAVQVSRVLVEEAAAALALATVAEAAELRKAGIQTPLLIMGRMLESEIEAALRWRAEISIAHFPMARAISKTAVAKNTLAPVHIKVDTGMTRIGIPWETASEKIRDISRLPGLDLRSVFTHFANADLADREFTRLQQERFDEVRRKLEEMKVPQFFHMANSAAILTSQAAPESGARPGIMLYGASPSEVVDGEALKPVLSWKCRVLQVRDVPEGTGISYGHDYITPAPSRIATISVGYADGFFRALGNRGRVLIRGSLAPIRGRVTMDMTMAEVTHIPGVSVGDEVVLIGSQGDSAITANELASWSGTIGYEVLCAISPRVKRFYREEVNG